MIDLKILNLDGIKVVDSREVAEMTDKRHADLLESIDGYCKHLLNGNFRSVDFFIPSTYQDTTGRTLSCFLLTRKGCDMVANKMTGEKGVLFTATYVTKFEEMEKQIINPYLSLSPELKAIFVTDRKVQEIDTRVDKLESTMTIDYTQQEVIRELANITVIRELGGKSSPAYKLIGNKAFAEQWRNFKRVMQVNSYRNTPTVDFEKAKEVVQGWKPDQELSLMIMGANLGQVVSA